METIAVSIITSLVVSFLWSKWFMKNLEKWMDEFFNEETAYIKKLIDADIIKSSTKRR